MDWLLYVLIGALVICVVIVDVLDPYPTKPDADHTYKPRNDISGRRAEAIRKMREHNIKTLLEGHRGWARVNPMAAPDVPKKVVKIRKAG